MRTADVILYDEHAGWSPSLNASKGTGGFEVYMVQIASWLAEWGHDVLALSHFTGYEHGVRFRDSRIPWEEALDCTTLVTCRASRVPDYVRPLNGVLAVQVDDPRPCQERFAHLKGRAELVCISEWQAGLFRELGHTVAAVIPSMIHDTTYRLAKHLDGKVWGRFVCLSAWNKGTEETLDAWARLPSAWRRQRHLLVGSPYSHPPDALERCAAADATWLGTLTPDQVTAWLMNAEAVFRVNVAPETFGVTDAIAEVFGCRVHMLCTNGVGGAFEALVSPYVHVDPVSFERHVLNARPYGASNKSFRVSTVMPRWLPVLFGPQDSKVDVC